MNMPTVKNLENPLSWLRTTILFLIAVFLFLLAIDLVGASVTMLGQNTARSILLATSNPFIGLFIGLLATALIQSSSTVTSMTVAVVASGYLTLENAIPVVMGANIGTTLTSSLVSLGFITNKNQFRKAISAGTIHDFFNILTVLILFPLEYYYGYLSRAAQSLTALVDNTVSSETLGSNISFRGISYIGDWLVSVLPQNFVSLLIALALLFFTIKFLSRIIYKRLIGSSKERVTRYVFDNPFKSFGWGVLVTGGVQSSSITTSLVVPMVASGKVKLESCFPFVLGANIGTTITALIAAINKSDAAVSLAFVHLIFNLVGVIIFLPFPIMRRIPVLLASKFGALARDSRIVGFSYIIFTFFLMPFVLISVNKSYESERSYLYENTNLSEQIMYSTIKVNREGRQDLISYHVFDGKEVEINDVPDTIFVLSENETKFITQNQVQSYDISSINAIGLEVLEFNNQASFSNTTLSLEKLNYLKVRLEDNQIGHFWYDADQKIFIQSLLYDSLGQLIESSKLISIR